MDDQNRGAVPWTPPLLEAIKMETSLKISNPDLCDSAIGSYRVVDSDRQSNLKGSSRWNMQSGDRWILGQRSRNRAGDFCEDFGRRM